MSRSNSNLDHEAILDDEARYRQYAAENNLNAMIKMEENGFRNFNAVDPDSGRTAFHIASSKSSIDVTEHLIVICDKEKKDKAGFTPLDLAINPSVS